MKTEQRRRGTVWKRSKNTYVARLRMDGKSYYGPSRGTRAEAEADLEDLLRRAQSSSSQTVAEYISDFLEGPYKDEVADVTYTRTLATARLVEKLPFGSLKLSELGERDLQEFVAHLKSVYKPSTVRREWAFISKALTNAVYKGLCPALKAKPKVKLPVVQQRHNTLLPDSEVSRLMTAPEGQFEHMLRVMLMTGLRRSEACALKWEHVDLENGFMYVPGTKSAGSAQTMPITEKVVESINAQPRVCDYVFTCQNERYEPWRLTSDFYEWRDSRGLPNTLRLHDLRGTFATILIRSGVDIKTVQTLMRHSTPEMTLKVYVQYDGNGMRAISDAFGRLENKPSQVSLPS